MTQHTDRSYKAKKEGENNDAERYDLDRQCDNFDNQKYF